MRLLCTLARELMNICSILRHFEVEALRHFQDLRINQSFILGFHKYFLDKVKLTDLRGSFSVKLSQFHTFIKYATTLLLQIKEHVPSL